MEYMEHVDMDEMYFDIRRYANLGVGEYPAGSGVFRKFYYDRARGNPLVYFNSGDNRLVVVDEFRMPPNIVEELWRECGITE